MVKRTSGPAPAMTGVSTGGSAIDPIRMLRMYYPFGIAAGIVGVVIGVAAYVGLMRFAPKWAGVVTYEVLAPKTDAEDVGATAIGIGGQGDKEMQRFMETQTFVLVSDRILDEALDDRDLKQTTWAARFTRGGVINRPEALKELRKVVSARVVPDTTVINLRAVTPVRQDAPRIANAISTVYMEQLRRSEQRDLRSLVQSFEAQRRSLQLAVEQDERAMETLLGQMGLTSLNNQHSIYFNEMQNLQPALVVLREQLSQSREQLSQFEQYLNADAGVVYPEMIRQAVESTAIVQQQKANIATQKAILRSYLNDFGANHREVKRIENVIRALEDERDATIQREMAEQFRTTMEGLRTNIANLQASEVEFTARLENTRQKLTEVTRTLTQHDSLKSKRDEKLKRLSDLDSSITSFNLLLERPTRVRKLNDAQIPEEPAFPRLVPTVFMSVFLCCGLVGGLIFLKEVREQRVRGPQDVALIPRIRLMGFVPDISMDLSNPPRIETAAMDAPQGAIAESVRRVRTALAKHCDQHGHKSVLVVSGLPGSGGTTLVSNLALSAAATDRRVLLIDGNIRRPALHRVFGVSNDAGVGDVLLGTAAFESTVVPSGIENLDILPAGTRDARVYERFSTKSMADLINRAKEMYDLVLIDAPPAVVASDAMALAGTSDCAILVVRAYSEKRGLVARVRDQLGESRTELVGVVVNAVKPSAGGYFKRNFQATHEYSREPGGASVDVADEPRAEKPKKPKKSRKKTKDTIDESAYASDPIEQDSIGVAEAETSSIDSDELTLDDLDLSLDDDLPEDEGRDRLA